MLGALARTTGRLITNIIGAKTVARINNELADNWEHALKRTFPSGIPAQASWTQTGDIAKTLASIAAANTGHMFFPDGGGEDLTGVKATQAGLIELHAGDARDGTYVVKIDTLEFRRPLEQSLVAYFMLNLSPISTQAQFAESSNEYREEFAEAGTRTYTFSEFMEGRAHDGASLPAETRRINRFWGGGKIAIFAKASPYNDQQVTNRAFGFDAYEAYHLKDAEFSLAVKQLAQALDRQASKPSDIVPAFDSQRHRHTEKGSPQASRR